MKLLLEIEDNKASHLLEVLKSLPYVKTTEISKEKAELIQTVNESIQEYNLIRKGKLKGISANQLLNDL